MTLNSAQIDGNTSRNNAASRSYTGPYRVMVVDDSAIIRGLTAKWLDEEPSIKVVNTSSNGEMAVKALAAYDPEVVVLDIEMPVMDGMTALPKILAFNPNIQVLMASTLTKRNAEVSLRALTLGAVDYVSKPETNREVTTSVSYQDELIGKVVNLAAANRRKHGGEVFEAKDTTVAAGLAPAKSSGAVNLAPRKSTARPDVVAVGSSTGGPQALLKFFNDVKDYSVPFFVTQHMPAKFTKILADNLTRAAGIDCKEAEDGDVVAPGKVFLAPGDYHMLVVRDGGKKVIRLTQDAPENFCRPAVDPMLRSIIQAYGSNILSVILTGMGHDGLAGCKDVVAAGGSVIAQDQQTSVVWGMPGAVSEAGICSDILPLDAIGNKVNTLISGGAG